MTESKTPLDWRESIEAQNFEQAAARLQALELVQQGEPVLLQAVEDMIELQKAVRSKQYQKAMRLFPAVQPLGPWIPMEQLQQGLQNLLSLEQEEPADPQAYQQRIAAALECPLTRGEALNRLAVLHIQRGDPVQARVHFEQAVQADPRHYRAISNLGNIAQEAGNLQEAEAHYRKALEINPEYPLAHNNLAVLMRKQKKLGESIKMLKTSHRLERKAFQNQAREEAQAQKSTLKWLPMLMYGVVGLVVVWLLFLR